MKTFILVSVLALSTTALASVKKSFSCPKGTDQIYSCVKAENTAPATAVVVCEDDAGLSMQVRSSDGGDTVLMDASRTIRVGATTYQAEEELLYVLTLKSSAPVRKNGKVYRPASLKVDDGMTSFSTDMLCSR